MELLFWTTQVSGMGTCAGEGPRGSPADGQHWGSLAASFAHHGQMFWIRVLVCLCSPARLIYGPSPIYAVSKPQPSHLQREHLEKASKCQGLRLRSWRQ
ncbi:hypothetical protein J0S82_016041 [Galemys pyrenaicus]|uniref:Uncharacterized protein n=1 Tax=Galemys pyrenaicus TaxID=202257 RepID=A0A8J6DNR1_GALPY|nr:hypothetical protein J0S82_016041 [Galemys pyrenaicus]